MKKWLCLFLCAMATAWAQDEQSRLNQFRELYKVSINGRQDLQRLADFKIEIDRCSGIYATEVFVYATPEEVATIKFIGLAIEPAPVTIGQDSREVAYHTYTTMTQALQEVTARYPQIARLESIGKTVQNREMWIVKISDNVGSDEAEPEVKYISTMHGDEVVGKELMIYLIQHLLENYGKDPWITQLINDLEIWIMPNMNPDGTELRRRYNANWVDLNRNFPDPESDSASNPDGRAIETQNMMKFSASRNFIHSLNFHGGAVVVNYPWDTKAGDIPDAALTRFLSLGYSKKNPPMYASTAFKNGITNGYDWYEVNGGMQDWNYHWLNDMDLTIEVSQQKWPDAQSLPKYWDENKASLLWHLTQARRGVHGIVRDSGTGQPLRADVSVVEIAKSYRSSAAHGDYHRTLLPGTYTLKFSAPGYEDAVFSGVSVPDNDTTGITLNVDLKRK